MLNPELVETIRAFALDNPTAFMGMLAAAGLGFSWFAKELF